MEDDSTEVGAQAARLAKLFYAPLHRILRDGLLPVQASRSAAYGRLNAALREFTAEPASIDYQAVCSNCTEDLKLASEGVLALQSVCARRAGRKGTDAFVEVAAACGRLQALEEQKMVAVVSIHAIKRSKKVGRTSGVFDALGRSGLEGVQRDGDERPETLDEKVVRFSKRLAGIDQDIAEIVMAWREVVLECEEDEDSAASLGKET
jgi:hypothetical protein